MRFFGRIRVADLMHPSKDERADMDKYPMPKPKSKPWEELRRRRGGPAADDANGTTQPAGGNSSPNQTPAAVPSVAAAPSTTPPVEVTTPLPSVVVSHPAVSVRTTFT